MRLLQLHPGNRAANLSRTDDRDRRLAEWLEQELIASTTARKPLEAAWIEANRQYESVPQRLVRDVPVPNAPNIEIPVGAILTDDLYAQATDTLFTASPLVTVRPTNEMWVEHAKAMQMWLDLLVSTELDIVNAANTAMLDDVKLGTGVYYIPFVENVKKGKVHRVTDRGPRVFAISPEDYFVPHGSRGNMQSDLWVGLRFWYTKGEMEERARARQWDLDGVEAVAKFDLVRRQSAEFAKMRSTAPTFREVFEVFEVYAYYDYDEDGYEEDLLITFDRPSRTILDVKFNPYDTRPIEPMRYQRRGHLPFGLGVMEMSQPLQLTVTELWNANQLNVFLANAKHWVADENALTEDSLVIYPGKVTKVRGGDVSKAMAELSMSEVHPSALIGVQQAIQFAERRVGTAGASGILASGGNRTPGVTALSVLQQVNRRFAPAFNDMRDVTGRAVVQAVMRVRERLKAGDQRLVASIQNQLDMESARLVIEVLREPNFEQTMQIQFTASSASINREADRQNALLLTQLLGAYYQRTVELATIAAQPDTPPNVQQVLLDVAARGTELMDRTIRTFEQVRDPQAFLVKLEEAAGALTPQQPDVLSALIEAAGAQQGAPEPPFAGVA